MTLLALVLLALPPGASLAAGLQAEAVSCCCSDGRAAPDVQARFDAPSCCRVSDGASLPTTEPAAPTHVPTTVSFAICDDANAPIATIESRFAADGVAPDLGRRPPPSLFTLHAAFLI